MGLLETLRHKTDVQDFLESLPAYIRDRALPVYYKAGVFLFHKNDPVQYAYILLSGETRVVNILPDGNYFSWLTVPPCSFISHLELLAEKSIYLADMVAAKDSIALRMKAADFAQYMKTDIDFLWKVASSFARENYEMSYNQGNRAYKASDEVLMLLLLKYCSGDPPRGQTPITVRRTRQDMASETGFSTKTINRSLAKLRGKSYLSIRSGKVVIDEIQHQRMLNAWRELTFEE